MNGHIDPGPEIEISGRMRGADFPRDRRSVPVEDALTFAALAHSVKKNVSLILVTALLIELAAVVYLKLAPYVYTAYMNVIPVVSAQSNARPSGLSAILGGALGKGTEVDPFDQYRFSFSSASVAQRLVEHHPEIVRTIFAKEWDKNAQRWRSPDTGVIRQARRLVLDFFGYPPWSPPDGARLAEFIEKKVAFKMDLVTHVANVSFQYPDPVFAEHFLNILHQETVAYLQGENQKTLELKLRYLDEKVRNISMLAGREVLVAMLAQTEIDKLTSQQGMPFAAKVLDGPVASPLPTSPKPILLLAVALVTGLAIGVFLAVFSEITGIGRRRKQGPATFR